MNRAGHCWRCESPCTQRCSRCRVAFYYSKGCQKQDKWRHEPDCDDAVLKTKCLGCGAEREGMMKCSNCLDAHYCGVECQRNHWPQHRSLCQETLQKTIDLADRIKQFFEYKQKNAGLVPTYYWGNVPAVDLINLSMNEGEEYSNPLALLLCGVGDPRNVLLTIASLPDVYKQQATFVLNDICPCTLARTVLLLYMLYKGGNCVTDAVIRVWYSLYISEGDFSLLMSALHDLVTTAELRTLTEGVMEISADQLSQLKDVWVAWLRLAHRKGSWVEELRQEANSRDLQRESGIKRYIHAIPKEHRLSAQRYFDTGIFSSSTTKGETLTQQNPTLMGRGFLWLSDNSEFQYSIPVDVLPFSGWDYKAMKKFCHADSLPEMYSIYLSNILNQAVEKLQRNQIKFRLILADILDIEAFLPVNLKYDRITTSNLWDYYPLAVLLTKFKCLLKDTNPHAVMLTQTLNWAKRNLEFAHLLHCSSISDQIDLDSRAMKDTRNPELVNLSGMAGVIEYRNITREFLMFLRASLLTSRTDEELSSLRRKKKLPSIISLFGSLSVYFRDFIRNENTVFPFRWALNCRRVTMLKGFERTLEWKLLAADAGE
ncbi:uncharacterized protein LOC144651708 [Oculina patagonica]